MHGTTVSFVIPCIVIIPNSTIFNILVISILVPDIEVFLHRPCHINNGYSVVQFGHCRLFEFVYLLFEFRLLLPYIYFKDVNNNQRTVVQSFSLRNRAVFPIGFLSKFLVANSMSVSVSL